MILNAGLLHTTQNEAIKCYWHRALIKRPTVVIGRKQKLFLVQHDFLFHPKIRVRASAKIDHRSCRNLWCVRDKTSWKQPDELAKDNTYPSMDFSGANLLRAKENEQGKWVNRYLQITTPEISRLKISRLLPVSRNRYNEEIHSLLFKMRDGNGRQKYFSQNIKIKDCIARGNNTILRIFNCKDPRYKNCYYDIDFKVHNYNSKCIFSKLLIIVKITNWNFKYLH